MNGPETLQDRLVERARREARDAVPIGGSAAAPDAYARIDAAAHALETAARDGDDAMRALAPCRATVARALAAARRLPPTVTGAGSPAPAGTLVHRLTGDAARTAATWLGTAHGHAAGATRDAVLAYPVALVAAGYAEPDAVAAGLPGALLLGLLEALPGFGAAAGSVDGAPADPKAARAAISAVLDLVDTLVIAADEAASLRAAAEAYAAGGRAHRARRLLEGHLARTPGDADAALAHAHLLAERDADGRASRDTRRAFARAVSLAPDDAAAAIGLSRAHRTRGDVDAAWRALSRPGLRSATTAPDAGAGLDAELERVATLAAWHAEAERPRSMPRVVLDERERAAGRFHPDTLAAAAALHERHGTLAVEGAFDPALLDACREQFLAAHGPGPAGDVPADSLGIGDRRFQISLVIEGAFNDPGFYANGFVLALVRRLLDRQAILGSAVCATSLPGARAQHLHKDHRAIFTRDADDAPRALPCVAVTVMIPLVALDETVGTTEVRKGSHRLAARPSEALPAQRPTFPLGGFFLMDLALSHAGQANRSERVRPVVNMQYTRRWFVDNKNFRRQRPLEIPRAEWARVPSGHRALFDWARQPGARVGR